MTFPPQRPSAKTGETMSDSQGAKNLPAIAPTTPKHLEGLVETAKDYARGAKAASTLRAYAADWRHYTAWCYRHDFDPLPPEPQTIGLYLAALASDAAGKQPKGVRTIERRLSAIAWHCNQHGTPLDRADRHIAEVMSGIRRRHGKPPNQKEAVLAADLVRMIATLGHDLRDLRDRAILMLGFAGGLRRSEIVSLDCGPDQSSDGAGWIQFLDEGIVIRVRGKTGWREVEVGRGSSEATCPVAAVKTWLGFARIGHGPAFRSIANGKKVGSDRLTDKHVARLVKRTALAAGIRTDLNVAEREEKFSGHSLRAGLATSAAADEGAVQKQLGHASPEMTRRYQRNRERFRVNLTKAAGL
jgi:integrase